MISIYLDAYENIMYIKQGKSEEFDSCDQVILLKLDSKRRFFGNMAVILKIVFKFIIQNSSWGTHCEIALMWMPQQLINEKSTLVQIMAWCHQATSHCQANVDPDLCRQMASLGHNE